MEPVKDRSQEEGLNQGVAQGLDLVQDVTIGSGPDQASAVRIRVKGVTLPSIGQVVRVVSGIKAARKARESNRETEEMSDPFPMKAKRQTDRPRKTHLNRHRLPPKTQSGPSLGHETTLARKSKSESSSKWILGISNFYACKESWQQWARDPGDEVHSRV